MLVVVTDQLRADAASVPAAEVAGLGHGAVQQQLPGTHVSAICPLLEVPGVQALGQLRGVGVGQQGVVISEHNLPSDIMKSREGTSIDEMVN